jgi:hypothetical protein
MPIRAQLGIGLSEARMATEDPEAFVTFGAAR